MRYSSLRSLAVALLLLPPTRAAGQEGIWLAIPYGDSTVVPAFQFKNGEWRGVRWEDAEVPGTWYYASPQGDTVLVTTGERLDVDEGGWGVLPVRGRAHSDLLQRDRGVIFASRPLEVATVPKDEPEVIRWSWVYDVVVPLFEDAEAAFADDAPYLPPSDVRAGRPIIFERLEDVTLSDAGDGLILATVARAYDERVPPPPGQGRCPWISRWQGWLLRRWGEPLAPMDAGSFSVSDCDGKGGRSFSPVGSFLWEEATYVVGWEYAYSSWQPMLYRFDGTLVLVAGGPGFGP